MLNNKLNNNKRVLGVKNSSSRNLNSNNMRRETIVPLVIGLLIGALFVVFFQFNSRLNNNAVRLTQLEQATAANTKNVTDVITFINNATKGATGTGAGAQTPATTPAQ
jgi:hypothetical protein